MDQSTVLIISDDADFSRVVMDRWQGERNAPAFTLMSGDLCRDLDADGFDMAVVGAVRPEVLPAVFKALDPAGNPVVFVGDGKQSAQKARQMQPGVNVLQQQEGWLDALVLVAKEALSHGQTWPAPNAPSWRSNHWNGRLRWAVTCWMSAHPQQCTDVGPGKLRTAVAGTGIALRGLAFAD